MSKRLLSHALSIRLRDSAYALHLRHTTECVLQRVLHFRFLSRKLHRYFVILTVYIVYKKSQEKIKGSFLFLNRQNSAAGCTVISVTRDLQGCRKRSLCLSSDLFQSRIEKDKNKNAKKVLDKLLQPVYNEPRR